MNWLEWLPITLLLVGGLAVALSAGYVVRAFRKRFMQ
jgi:hypothetical protein